MRRTLALAALVSAGALLVPLTATPAAAAPAVRIARIYWDSPGTDSGSNASLNDEWIKIKNYGDNRRNLRGWKIKDADGHTFTFPAFHLDAGESVKIHSGAGANRAHHLYWDYGNYAWTNDGDKARLKNDSGDLVDKCKFTATSDNPKNC